MARRSSSGSVRGVVHRAVEQSPPSACVHLAERESEASRSCKALCALQVGSEREVRNVDRLRRTP